MGHVAAAQYEHAGELFEVQYCTHRRGFRGGEFCYRVYAKLLPVKYAKIESCPFLRAGKRLRRYSARVRIGECSSCAYPAHP